MNYPFSYKFQEIDLENNKPFSYIFPEIGKKNYAIKKPREERCSPYIEYNDLKVYRRFLVDLISEARINIEWVKAREDIPQGIDTFMLNIRLKLLDGSARETKKGLVFMYSRWAPNKVPLLCLPIKFRNKEKQHEERLFCLYNVWEMKRSDGRMERCSCGGNYGVVIEKKERDVYRLYFSCGHVDHPHVTFEDLVVDVTIEGEYRARFECSKFKL